MTDEWLVTKVARRALEADGIVSLELTAADERPLPHAEAGGHVDVDVGQGLIRQYSLCGDPADGSRYRLGILLEPASRGGSAAMHHGAAVGERLLVRPPRNTFRLHEASPFSLLLAGGIGVTPLMSMAHRLHGLGRPFDLQYCVRSRSRAAFADELVSGPFGAAVTLNVDDEPKGGAGPIAALEQAPPGTHVYICGPAGFIDAMVDAAIKAGYETERRHVERFTVVPEAGESFVVVAARRGVEVEVGPDQTIADALIEAGIDVQLSCEAGVCGTCLTRVIEGLPDHRDQFQTDEEKAVGGQMTICCSRSFSPRLVLDV